MTSGRELLTTTAERALTPALLAGPCGHFARGQDSPDDRRVQLVLLFANISSLVLHSQNEDWEISFRVEVLFGHGDRQYPVKAVFAVGGFVAVLLCVPGENADLIEVKRQAVVGVGQYAKILRDLFLHTFVIVRHFIQYEEGDEALALGVLSYV